MKLYDIVVGVITALIFFGVIVLTHPAEAGPLDETVFCGPPARDAAGQIIRSSAALSAFKKLHPCPATRATSGPCLGWIMDHPKPLACGYCDSVDNIQWLPIAVWREKSKWERVIYGGKSISKGCP